MTGASTPHRGTPRVVAHRGAFRVLPDVCDELGLRRVILVAGASVEAPATEAARMLGARCAGRFSHPVPHVPAKEANLAVASAQEIHADGVVGIGGGSAVGYGKVIALALRLPLVAVPTTYTGGEMTDRYAVTTDSGKETGTSPRVMPRVVLRDPALTAGTPPSVTASSGMTAIGHCLETLWAAGPGAQALSRARTALRTLFSTLPRLLDDPGDDLLREQALHAAELAGRAHQTQGAGVLTVLAEKLGGDHLADHGALVGCLAPHVHRLYGRRAAVAELALTQVSGCSQGPRALADLTRRLGLPPDVAALGAGADAVRAAASTTELAAAFADFPSGAPAGDLPERFGTARGPSAGGTARAGRR